MKLARTTMYHVAPSTARYKIKRQGLQPDGEGVNRLYPDSPSGVYLWGDIVHAENWAEDVSTLDGISQDIWEVDASNLPIKQDAVWYNEEHDVPNRRAAWMYPGPISPDAIRLIDTFRTANILDPIEPTLDQTVYDGTNPKYSVRHFIKKLYYRALDKRLGVTGEQWADLYLTGSLTTYQYSVTSDCDISVFPNYDLIWKDLGLTPDEARKKLISLSIEHIDGTFLPGTTHPLQFFVVPHGTLPSDLYKPGLRSAYDLHDDLWFQAPEKDRVHDIALEYPELFKRAQDIGDKLTQMLDAHDDEAAKELWHQIHKKRQLDQQAGLGDFCEGNIVYKYLLNEGVFDRLRNELHEYIAKIGFEDVPYQNHGTAGKPDEWVDADWLIPTLRFGLWQPDKQWDEGWAVDAVLKGRIVGYLRTKTDGTIENIGVRPNLRRNGLASAMVDLLRERGLSITHNWDEMSEDGLGWATTVGKEYIAKVATIERYDTELASGHADTRTPWIYVPETDRLVIGSPGSEHRHMMKYTPDADQGTEWYGAYGELSNRVTIFSQYDFDDFNYEDIDPDLIRNLREAWPNATIWYNDIDGDRVKYASTKWSMPPAEQWEDFANDVSNADVSDVTIINGTGIRWRYNDAVLMQVATVLGQPLTLDVSRTWYEGYGHLSYQYTEHGPFNFKIMLNKMLSPEAATYCLWHEIQHAFQLVEGRADVGSSSPQQITRDNFDQYVTDPSEVDADQMAANLLKLRDLQIIEEIPVTEGDEKEYYESLIEEGWPQDEALDMLTTPEEEISLAEVLKARTSSDLWADRVTQKVIYDFDKDTITLGTQATQAENPDSKIIGEYDDGIVTLYDVDKQWITPSYFHRLWHFSFPGKELKDVYYKRGDEDSYKLRMVRKRKRSSWKLSEIDQTDFMNDQATKFVAGDAVIMKAYGESGSIIGEPYLKDGEWWYLVKAYDREGPIGEALYPERDLERPTRYDQPAEMTLKDMFGIPPEGEQYFRDAKWKLADGSSDFVDFFDNASKGLYAPEQYLNPSFENPKPQQSFDNLLHQQFYDTHKNYAGNFDQHIETSIPGYRELQVKKGTAITQAFPHATVLDLGGSEGSWNKAISQLGGNQTTNLEPNAAMIQHFNQNPVNGAELVPQAFGEGFEYDGVTYPKFEPGKTYDIINESMTFQFISPDRATQVAEVKRLLTPNGLFLTDEKLITPEWEQNEQKKDEWKKQFYNDQQLQDKQQVVNYNDEESAVGMVSNMVYKEEYEAILHQNFAVVNQYWSSGNFAGYACSDNQPTVNHFIQAYGS